MRKSTSRRVILLALGASCVASVFGCAGAGLLPEVDLEASRWTVATGQALWKPGGGRRALAGEVIVARHENGDVLVSFSKPPVPIFTAQTAGRSWRIDFVERGRTYSGRGRAPRRFIWFRLPELLAGAAAPKHWNVERQGADEWALAHRRSGETVRLVLDPEREHDEP